jgi:2-polyprenyl-3-methyl-5-hydroxy-6-metoxy-1,4-benzoquinol methylase
MQEKYTPGYNKNSVSFMSNRRLETHGAFFLPFLTSGMTVLDCGCGPGVLTCDIAERIPNGRVLGIDLEQTQIKISQDQAKVRQLKNVRFQQANVYDLESIDETFDAVFSHALLEHLKEPFTAIQQFHRVLKPGGILAVCSPDWGGFLLAPSSSELNQAIEAYKNLQIKNGGDVFVGSKLLRFFEDTGFNHIEVDARYEVYKSLDFIGQYLALQLVQAGEETHGQSLKNWMKEPNGFFAQAWVSCVGKKNTK